MVVTRHLELRTSGHGDIVDITGEVGSALRDSGLHDGVVTLFVSGATGGLTTIEFEPGLVHDFKDLFERLAPEGLDYEHNKRWGDGNGHSHVRASLLGPSLNVPFADGALILGTWQQIVFVDFDNRSRERRLVLQFMGEPQ